MPATIFTKLQNTAAKNFKNTNSTDARDWFRQTAKRVRRANPAELLRGSDMTSTPQPGRMYLFKYNPKHKGTLPYWDQFPLIFMLDAKGGTFGGLNLHYIPPVLRARLMDALYDYSVNISANDKSTAIAITYNILKSTARLKAYKPTFKLYRKDHVQSNFMYIAPDVWNIAMMLPLARFQKQSINTVYKDSRSEIDGNR